MKWKWVVWICWIIFGGITAGWYFNVHCGYKDPTFFYIVGFAVGMISESISNIGNK